MNDGKCPVSAVPWSGLGKAVRRKGANLARLLLILGAVLLAVPAVSFGDEAGGADLVRLAALVRFYTDPYERAAHAGSARYTAVSAYVRDVLFADRFGGSDDPARWAAVARFLTDRHEQAANAGCWQYCALANSLRGVERVRAASTPSLGLSANQP